MAPRAWLEHVVAGRTRRLALKALRPYEFADAAGKPNASCMDPDTGASVLLLQMPVKWPSGWVHGDHDLVLDNGVGLAVFPFATAP